ncbi:MAG TPA: hypothetical protein VMK32_03375 [Burkholderiaceae bacterium]|nr:hypothetical protein [Burkholderiaceae bacterium]
MKRRTLLKAASAAGLMAAAPWTARSQSPAADSPGWRTFEVTTRLEITQPTGQVMAWVPLPLTQKTAWFETIANSIGGNAEKAEIVVDPIYGAGVAAARFKSGEAQPVVEVTSRFRTRDRLVTMAPGGAQTASAQELAVYLKPTELLPTDGIVSETAIKVTQGVTTDVDKARAIYDWVIENTQRNPATKGCGVGDIRRCWKPAR